MATITVKKIPDDLYERLKQAAGANHRSINSEAIVCIERALGALRREDVEATLARARENRKLFRGPPITDEELNEMKRWGRP